MSTQINDRAAGVLLGTACGDALGAGYEGGPPLPDDAPIAMIARLLRAGGVDRRYVHGGRRGRRRREGP